MHKFTLLKKMLPSLFPLIVFIVVDEFYGTSAGLIVAVGFGIAQLIFTYIRERVFDRFTLVDTLLIVLLGSVSYVLDNDIFFKLKPALVGTILCAVLGVSSFSKMNVVALMSRKYLDGMTLSEEQVRQFSKSTRAFFYIAVVHTLLVFYSAFYMSKEAWAFISTVMLYILFGAYMLFELVRKWLARRNTSREEWVPLVDDTGTIIGKAPRSAVHSNKELLHPVVHLHVINSKKQIYLQKRLATKLVEPGKWDASVGGHIAFGESVEDALKREAVEEIGITEFKPVSVCQYILKTQRESEFVFLLYTNYDGEIRINKEEVEEGRFWRPSELNRFIGTGVLTPSFEIEYGILKKQGIV
jgi:isopentenyldiphosphate isomerase/intracellular septation protein A